MSMDCEHDGYHTGQGRYSHETGRLHYVVVCDDCQAELREVSVVEYRPVYDPHGNDTFRTAA